MMMFALFGIFIGLILGARFTVLALIPVMICALFTAGVSAVTNGKAFNVTIIELALLLICLQIGYFGGAARRLSIYLTIEQPSDERPYGKKVHPR
jgi:H+/Cl- antiporter ClcA